MASCARELVLASGWPHTCRSTPYEVNSDTVAVLTVTGHDARDREFSRAVITHA
jgi:hypothetical protein